jgi:hypothetical protein
MKSSFYKLLGVGKQTAPDGGTDLHNHMDTGARMLKIQVEGSPEKQSFGKFRRKYGEYVILYFLKSVHP